RTQHRTSSNSSTVPNPPPSKKLKLSFNLSFPSKKLVSVPNPPPSKKLATLVSVHDSK
ncbi:hypothetical protein L195_g064028, partial [Trifolium pratense]